MPSTTRTQVGQFAGLRLHLLHINLRLALNDAPPPLQGRWWAGLHVKPTPGRAAARHSSETAVEHAAWLPAVQGAVCTMPACAPAICACCALHESCIATCAALRCPARTCMASTLCSVTSSCRPSTRFHRQSSGLTGANRGPSAGERQHGRQSRLMCTQLPGFAPAAQAADSITSKTNNTCVYQTPEANHINLWQSTEHTSQHRLTQHCRLALEPHSQLVPANGHVAAAALGASWHWHRHNHLRQGLGPRVVPKVCAIAVIGDCAANQGRRGGGNVG